MLTPTHGIRERAVALARSDPLGRVLVYGALATATVYELSARGSLHRFLDSWLPQIEELPSARRVRWALDVDPIELF